MQGKKAYVTVNSRFFTQDNFGKCKNSSVVCISFSEKKVRTGRWVVDHQETGDPGPGLTRFTELLRRRGFVQFCHVSHV
jgi:hypothetical protein